MNEKLKNYTIKNKAFLVQNKIKEFLEFVYNDSSLTEEEKGEIFKFVEDELQYFAQSNSYNFTKIPNYYDIEDNNNPHGVFGTSTIVYIGDGTTKIREYQFHNCNRLKSITFPESLKIIEDCAFAGCTNIKSIVLPNSLKKIGDEAFACCENLQSIVIPDSVETLGHSAFQGCYELTSVNIPKNLKSFGYYVFDMCESLEEILIPKSLNPEVYKSRLPIDVEIRFI